MPSKRPKRASKVPSEHGSPVAPYRLPERRGVGDVGSSSDLWAQQHERADQPEEERFYNQPSADADWSYWAKAEFWTMEEAVALSFGKDPSVVNSEKLLEAQSAWQFTKNYMGRLNLFQRAVDARALRERSKPAEVIRWMQLRAIGVPEQLLEELTKLGMDQPTPKEIDATIQNLEAQLADAQAKLAASSKEVDRLRSQIAEIAEAPRRSDERMIYAMAIKKFQFKPDERNSAATNIASLCDQAGYPVSDRAVRDRLKDIAKKLTSEEREG